MRVEGALFCEKKRGIILCIFDYLGNYGMDRGEEERGATIPAVLETDGVAM